MAKKKKIIIDCYPDGHAKLEGEGFEGTECNKVMAFFEKLMGKKTNRGNNADMRKVTRQSCQLH